MTDFSDIMIKLIITNRLFELNDEINKQNIKMDIQKVNELYKPIPHNIILSSKCLTCYKLYYGYRNKKRLMQHCDSLNHKYC
jgi:hypothetical protein